MDAVLGYVPFPAWLKPEIIPGLPFRWYGLMYLVAFAVAYLLVRVQVREKGLSVPKDDVLNLFFWAIVGLMVGARLVGVTLYDPDGYYLTPPLGDHRPGARHRRPAAVHRAWRACPTTAAWRAPSSPGSSI